MFKNLCTIFVLFMIYSFLGWLMEVMLTIVRDKKFVNRGFLVGPYCPIYGYGCLFITILLKRYLEEPIALFLMAVVICSILEYMTSYVMEKLFNARWWDYSKKKFNLNGRICLETMIPFGILGVIVMYFINPFFLKVLMSFSDIFLEIIAVILFIIYIVDTIITGRIIFNFKNEFVKASEDKTEEITKMVKETLAKRGYLHKRLINAFPNLKTHREMLIEIRSRINKEIKKMNNLR